ncbi:MAG: SAM-dependent methyltransferase [Alphaproteobacteria bacterium]
MDQADAEVALRRPTLLAIALLSGAALGLEVLLLRLFAIIQWHHFASMAIGLALLGWGVSGSVLTATAERVRTRFSAFFTGNAAAFGVSAVAAFSIAQRIPFNPPELLWDWRQPLWLAAIYLVLAVPFLFAANAIAAALMTFRGRSGRVYGADLLGAGTGAVAVVGVLTQLPETGALAFLSGLGPVAAALVIPGGPRKAVLLALAALLWASWVDLRPSPFKPLSRALQVVGADVVAERSGPLGRLTVVANSEVPFRDAPGLALTSPTGPPEQRAIFVDGEGPLIVDRHQQGAPPPPYLDHLTSALPYHLGERRQVLLLGLGGGRGILQALLHGAQHIDVTEPDSGHVALLRDELEDFSGHLLEASRVHVHIGQPRSVLATAERRWDLIALEAGGSAAGLGAAGADYRLTVEAFADYLTRLAPGGLLAVSGPIDLPPRAALRLLATAVAALGRAHADAPGRHLVMVRSWQTVTMVVSADPLPAGTAGAVRVFVETRGFDPIHFPDMRSEEANRRVILDVPWFYDAAKALLEVNAEPFMARWKYAIAPATDDRPFFHDFFRWALLPEVLALRERGGMGLFEWGHLVVVAALIQAVLAAVILVPLPLLIAGRRGTASTPGLSRPRTLCYFLALGLAFLCIEIAFLERFVLFLGHPVLAAAVCLAGFLVFAGLGSQASHRIERPGRAATATAILSLAYLAGLPPLFEFLAPLPTEARGLVSVALIAPLGFFMGMPFPLGLAALDARAPRWVPWAWAVNGCASVIASPLAGLMALEFGFSAVIAVAACLYLLAATVAPPATTALCKPDTVLS